LYLFEIEYYHDITLIKDFFISIFIYKSVDFDRSLVMKQENIRLINQIEVNYFLHRIKKNFPNFVAGVITDKNGFTIGSDISKRLWIHENKLALWAISKNKKNKEIIDDPNLIQLKFDIDKEKKYKLFILLEKSKYNKNGVKPLKTLIRAQELF